MTEWPDPFARFTDAYARAAVNPPMDPTAMVLGTATPAAAPSMRVVLLKGFDNAGFLFFTNYLSRKSMELDLNPQASLLFYWAWLGEQIRVEGRVEKVSPEESDSYFKTRPRRSQIGAWASEQSRPLESREALLEKVKTLEELHADKEIPRPPHWGGWRLIPSSFEFWYDGENRLHDRFVYTRHADGWEITRLNP